MFTFNLISAIILFVAFFIEFTLILLQKPEKDVVDDMKSNAILGVCLVLTGLITKVMAFGVFSFAYSYALFTPKLSWWLWIVGFLGCDLMHWVYHWFGHKTRLFWAAHVTHHSSQHFNLSTGWRTNFIHLFYRFLFWAPLCLFGIPPEMILLFESISAIQNFIVHTERVGKLGILDLLFNTPSNHRVHHAVNPEYIDKNLGGILMIYDHLFGTYAKEEATPVYGITHNINSNNPITILLHQFFSIGKEVHTIKGLQAKFRFLFSPPQ
ncbi:MAG: sterol desaturase family protein [Ferruginibacter sp.]